MASGGKTKSASNSGAEPVKRRKVGFSADATHLFCHANECLKLHIVFAGSDLERDDSDEEYTFDSEFSERIFGEDGKIYGYKGLKIDLWMHATTFNTYAQIRYDSKGGGKKPITNVLSKLKEVFGDGLTEDRVSFLQSLLTYSEDFQQMLREHGEVIYVSRSATLEDNVALTAARSNSGVPGDLKQIFRLELTDPAVRAWHAHLYPLALLFIEGAQPLQPPDDPSWEVYLALDGEGPLVKLVGFCNVFRFYHYPDSMRLRISQVLVLPPYQGSGFGLHLLQAVNMAASQRSCYDVTMEEPSVALQKLRDTMDVLRVLSLPSLKSNEPIKDALSKLRLKTASQLSGNRVQAGGDQVSGALIQSKSKQRDDPTSRQGPMKEKSLLAPSLQLVEEVRQKLQINKVQFKRCWEQILYMFLDPEDSDLRDVFQMALVQRLNLEIFEKDSGNKGVDKQVVDTDNDYDSTKTFVMSRSRKMDSVAGNGCSVEPSEELKVADMASALTPSPEEKQKVLMEELKEREGDMLGVAQAVARHCRTLGLTLPSLQIWEQELPDSRENS